jgi:hypothetical protein
MSSQEGNVRRTPWLLLVPALILYLSAFGYALLNPESRQMGDSLDYLRASKNLLSKGVIYCGNLGAAGQIDPALYSRRPPLYPLFLAISKIATGGVLAAVLMQMLLTAGGAYLTWRIMEYLGSGRGLRLVVTTLFLFYPAQIIYSQVVMSEVLFQFLIVVSVFFMVRYLKHAGPRDIYLCNLAIGAAALCKPVMMFFWIPNLLFCLWLSRRKKGWHLWVAPLIPFLIISGWSYRNYELTGSYHFSSMGTTYLRLLTRNRLAREPGWERDLPGDANATILAFLEEVPKRLPALAKGYAIGVASFFVDPGRFDWYEFFKLPDSRSLRKILFIDEIPVNRQLGRFPLPVLGSLLVVLILNLVVFAGFAHSLVVSRDYSPAKVFMIALILYVAAVTSFAGASRYRLPVEPLLLILAGPFLLSIGEWVRSRLSHSRP